MNNKRKLYTTLSNNQETKKVQNVLKNASDDDAMKNQVDSQMNNGK